MDIEDYKKVQEEKDTKKYAWLRHIILMASGSLSVLISLHKDNICGVLTHVLFGASIALLGVGILCASIALYGEVHLAALRVKETGQYIIRQRKGDANPPFSFLDMPPIFVVCEKICYVCLVLAIIFLVLYSTL